MTGQALLDTMEILNAELQLQSGEADVTKGLLALNIAQDHFEAAAAQRADIFGSSDGTLTTTANQEYSLWPTGLLRLDGLQLLDSNGKVLRDLTPRYKTGSHAARRGWLANLTSVTSPGAPGAYWANGAKLFWDPIPDQVYTVRWYGLQAASDITTSGTFAYPDIVRLPIATFAVALIKLGLDDDVTSLSNLSSNIFEGTLDTLSSYDRSGARPLNYTFPTE